MPTPPAGDPGESATLAAVRRSVQGLDTDPVSKPTSGFRTRGRSALLRSSTERATSGKSFHPRRLAIVGVTVLLFGLIAMPAVAGPGAIANGVSGAANALGQMLGNGQGSHDSQDTDGDSTAAEHPGNHGADVSAAHSMPADGESHGEQVRTVARDNHGHQLNASSDSTPGSNDEQKSTTNGAEQNHGQQARSVAQDNHGVDVSAAAQSSSDDGTNHGEQVKVIAGDNHGADVSGAAQSASTGDATSDESVNTLARDNHGADVSATSQSALDNGENQAEQNGTGANDDDGNQ